MYKKVFYVLMCAGMLTLGACSEKNDKDDEPGGGTEWPGGNGDNNGGNNNSDNNKVLDATECKELLSTNARNFLNKFDPSEQKELNELCSYFVRQYGDLELPENFYLDDQRYYSPTEFFKAARSFTDGDMTGLSRAMTTYVYNVEFSNFAGIYEPGYYEWRKTGVSQDIVFRFNDKNGSQTELTISASSSAGTSDVSYEYEDWYESERYDVKLPKSMSVKLARGNGAMTYISATLNNTLNVKGHSFSVKETINCGNYEVKVDMQGTDTEIRGTETVSKNNQTLVVLTPVIYGSNLCNKDYIEGDSDRLMYMVQKVTGKAVIDGETVLNGTANNPSVLFDALEDDYYDDYDYSSKKAAQTACAENCAVINRNLSCELSFTSNSGTAKALVAPSLYESEYYWCYEYDYQLEFADGSRISMNDYFGRGFSSIVRQGESLWNAYCRMWSIF